MPELPEVETVRRGLQPAMEGARFARIEARRPDLRFPLPAGFVRRLEGARVTALKRRAKYLLVELDSGETLIMHLGMSGSFRIARAASEETPGDFHHARSKAAAHDHVVFAMSNGAVVTYNDPRRFGFMDLVATAEIDRAKHLAGLGLEPLDGGLDAAALARLFSGKAAPLKAALLDQKLIAGLGNIYVCEALHRAGLSPRRAAGALALKNGRPAAAAARLAGAIRDVLAEAVAAGGSSISDHRLTDGSLGYFQHAFRVYDREGAACPTQGCRGLVTRLVQSGRSTFWCSQCQR